MSRRTKDQLVIDKSVLKDNKTCKVNLLMGWIDCRKAYDMVPHSMITSVSKILKISNDIRKFIKGSMENWKTITECGSQQLGELRTKR